MENRGIRIFAYIAIVLMLASVIPAVALADSDNGQKKGLFKDGIQDRDRTRINATENATRSEIANEIKNVRNAQAQYAQAKKNFLNAKAKNKNLDSEEAINATKVYLNSTIEWMIDSLDEEEDADYIENLTDEKEKVDAADSRENLAEIAKEIRDIWKDARKEKISSRANSVNSKLNAVISTSEAMALRLENEIERMEQNGEDVTELNAMLDEYNALIEDAKEYQEQAREAYDNGIGNGEAAGYMNQAGQSIKDANAILKDMLKALKQHREGLVVLSGNGTVTAEGDGTAVISGNFTLDFTANDAMLVVKDMAGDANITTTDASYESSNVDSGNSDDNNRAFVYHNLTGDVTIEGSRLTVMLRGTDISLDVTGTGTAMLTGDGTYEVDGVESSWAEPDVDDEEEMESEEEESDDESSDEETDDDSSDDDTTEESGNTTESGNSTSGNQTSA